MALQRYRDPSRPCSARSLDLGTNDSRALQVEYKGDTRIFIGGERVSPVAAEAMRVITRPQPACASSKQRPGRKAEADG